MTRQISLSHQEAFAMQPGLIVADPKIMMGKPVIAGTRITVEMILDQLAAGNTVDDILDGYPHLTRDGILAAVAYAS